MYLYTSALAAFAVQYIGIVNDCNKILFASFAKENEIFFRTRKT